MAGPDELDDALRSLMDRSRADAAVAGRRRRAALRRQAAESGSFLGAVTDLAEQGSAVVIVTGTGHRCRGHITAIGADYVAVSDDRSRTVLICLMAAVIVHADPAAPQTIGDRVRQGATLLMDVLTQKTGQPVSIRTIWNESVTGTLHAVGTDVVTVRSETGRSVYIARTGITEVIPD